VTQSTDGNLSTIFQEGTDNLATHNQTVTDGNVANTFQFGSNNVATVNQ